MVSSHSAPTTPATPVRHFPSRSAPSRRLRATEKRRAITGSLGKQGTLPPTSLAPDLSGTLPQVPC